MISTVEQQANISIGTMLFLRPPTEMQHRESVD